MAQISNFDDKKFRQAFEKTESLQCTDLPIGSGKMMDDVLEGAKLIENDSELKERLRRVYTSEIC